MYCGKCGTEVQNSVSFCPNCGNKINHIVETSIDDNNFSDGLKIKNQYKKSVVTVVLILASIVAIIGVLYCISTNNNINDNYYRSKTISYGIKDYNDMSSGLEVINTTYYNENGSVICEEGRYGDVINYSYDENGRIISIEVIDEDGKKSFLDFKYNSENDVEKGRSNVYTEDDYSAYYEYIYDSDNQLASKILYYNDKEFNIEKTEYYDSGIVKSRKSIQNRLNSDNEVDTVSESNSKYDENGYVIYADLYSFGEFSHSTQFEYQKAGKLYKQIDIDSNGDCETTILNKENNSNDEYIIYDSDNEIVGYSVITYDSFGNQIKSEIFDEDYKNLKYCLKYEYDQNNNCILTEIIQDGIIISKSEATYELKEK